ncbi:MAG: tetratricopeptide repeat protein [Planctomycetaceae bacterium]|nr:tetratricopeptide repeat protein [Planctomycetaceae bacterium]
MMRLFAAFIAAAVLFAAPVFAADNKALDAQSNTADILRQDVVNFAGTANNADLPQDAYLIRLNRKANGNTNYSMVVRNVDATEQALLDDAADGKWDNFTLFTAAAVAEGFRDADKISVYESKMNRIVANVNAAQNGNTSVSPKALTRELFEAMHRDVLTQPYDINCTEISKVFETGHFNCVSATVLFNILADKAGLDVCALEMPGHALSRVKFGAESMNVETTCSSWFELQNETSRKNAVMERAATAPAVGNPSVATADSAATLNEVSKNLREITPVQLIATIYYNKGVDFHAQKRYAEAAVANVKALQLDPNSETAWGNLMAAINNWAIEIVTDTKRYDLAAALLDQGAYLDPTYEKFQANQLHVFYHWIYDLAREGRIADAKTVYALAAQRLPGNADLQNLMQSIEK